MVFMKILRSNQIQSLVKLYTRSFPHCDCGKPHLLSSFSQESLVPTSFFRSSVSLSSLFRHKSETQPENSETVVKEKKQKKQKQSNEKVPRSPKFVFVKSEDEDMSSENPRISFVEETTKKGKKPLHLLFEEAVGLSEKLEESESDCENEEDKELKKKLRKLEEEVRLLRENSCKESQNSKGGGFLEENSKAVCVLKDQAKPKSLYAAFASNGSGYKERRIVKSDTKVEENMVFKDLSSDMASFANYLYKQGYLTQANFLRNGQFDVTCFENNYGRDFLKFAAEKFAEDNPEVAKWISKSDLKHVVEFGCPSTTRKLVFSAKALRTFYGIQEESVCSKCVLNRACKFANQSVWKNGAKNVDLAVAMRVLILYALESVHPQLVVPDEIKNCVTRLLKEIVHLSEVPC